MSRGPVVDFDVIVRTVQTAVQLDSDMGMVEVAPSWETTNS